MADSSQYMPFGAIRNAHAEDGQVCSLCGERPAYESHYGPELGLCCACAEAAANLWWKAHSGEFLTWEDGTARRRPAEKPVPQSLKWKVLREAGFACQACGATDAPMHVDHIVPRARGGGNEPENLQALCQKCNIRKGDKTLDEWRRAQ